VRRNFHNSSLYVGYAPGEFAFSLLFRFDYIDKQSDLKKKRPNLAILSAGQFIIPSEGGCILIELWRAKNSQEADWVEAGLKELVLGYDRIVTEAETAFGLPLPVLRHDGRLVSGSAALQAYLVELEDLAEAWRRFQGDSCYVDEKGEGACDPSE
jgi:hypothetical protein